MRIKTCVLQFNKQEGIDTMQIGITIPLQKQLKLQKPPYGEPEDLFYCWEVHVIRYQGKNTLVAVNANNRFFVMLSGMKNSDWSVMEQKVEEAIEAGLLAEGYTKEQIDRYFNLAGEAEITKTHGRKPVAGLNRAIDYLTSIPEDIDHEKGYQSFHCKEINARDLCSPAGFREYGYASEFFKADMIKRGIME